MCRPTASASRSCLTITPPPSCLSLDAHAPRRKHTRTSTTRNPQPHYTTAAAARLSPVTTTAAQRCLCAATAAVYASLPRHSCATAYTHPHLLYMQPTAMLHHCHCRPATCLSPVTTTAAQHRLCAATAAVYTPPPPPSTCQCHESRCGAFRKVPRFCCCESSGGRCLSQLIHSSFCPPSFYVNLSQDQGCAFAFCII